MMKGAANIVGMIYRPLGTLKEVARDRPFIWAILLYLTLPALFNAIENIVFSESISLWALFVERDPNMAIRMDTFYIVLPFLFVFGSLIYCSSRIFRGKGSFASTICTHAYSLIPLYLIIPLIFIANSIILGWPIDYSFYVIYLWHAALVFLSVRETHRLKTLQSIFVCLLAIFFAVILIIVIGFTHFHLSYEPL